MTLLNEHRLTPNGSTEADALIEEARQRQRRRRLWVGSILLVVAVASAVWAASNGGSAVKGPSSSKNASHAKSVASTPSTTAVTITAMRVIACGNDFFDSSDDAFLTRWFGLSQECGRLANADTWVDAVGGGVYGTTAPGGSVVLLETCASDDAACLDPNATHSLSHFRAYPAPDPIGDVKEENFLPKPGTTVGPSCTENCGVPARGGTMIYIDDGACSTDIFDIATGHWYFGVTKAAYQLAEGRRARFAEIPSGPSFPATQSPPPSRLPAACSGARLKRA